MDAIRAQLDSIMGTDRDAGRNEKKQSFKDADVCKHYLVWECPHDMFVDQSGKASANSPIGPCPNQHSEAMKDRFKQDPDADRHRTRWLGDLRVMLRRMIDEVDARIHHDKNRLRAGASCSKETAAVFEGSADAREMLIKEKMEAAERMASDGDVELSQKVMEQAERLAKQKQHLARVKEMADTWVDEICDTCGRQISWRAPEEIEARKHGRPHPHEMGQFHEGWLRARSALADIDKSVGDRRGEDQPRERSRKADRDRPRDRDRDLERDRQDEGDRRQRDRDGEPRREKDREADGAGRRNRDRDGEATKRPRSPGSRERRDRAAPPARKPQDEGYRERRRGDRGDSRSRSRRRGRGRG